MDARLRHLLQIGGVTIVPERHEIKDKVRQQMMGIVACRAMKHQDYKARLSVTPRERIRGFKGPLWVRRLDAFDGMEPVQSQQAGHGRTGSRPRKEVYARRERRYAGCF